MSTCVVDPAAEIAELRAMIAELQADRRARRSLRKRVSIVAALALAAAMVTGVAGASGPSNTLLSFVSVSPAFKLATNANIAAGATGSYVVTGAATTVPTDATTVRLAVSVRGTKAGTLTVYPASNSTGGSGQSLSWTANGFAAGTLMENVGAANKVSFHNSSAAAATVTATITGYSTQVTASDINGAGGTSGQVLTNTGTGATWQTPPPVTAATIQGTGGTSGQVLTNTGTSAAWQTQGQSYAASQASGIGITYVAYTTVDSLTVPAGTYQVTDTYTAQSSVGDFVGCALVSPDGNFSLFTYTAVTYAAGLYLGSGTVPMLLNTTGGTITLKCYDGVSTSSAISRDTLIATQVNAAHGAIVNTTPHAKPAITAQRAGTRR
jgi:hypothetical protein